MRLKARDIGVGRFADSIQRSHVGLRTKHTAVRSSLSAEYGVHCQRETHGSNASPIELTD
jgi:hypothetical protein